jgi:hypothetical protein
LNVAGFAELLLDLIFEANFASAGKG